MVNILPFEEHTQEYEDWFVRNRHVYQSELRAVMALMPARGIGLEVGVGTGRFASPLKIPFGVDPSPNMLRRAVQRGIDGVAGVGEALPFDRDLFDFILMVTTICFLDDLPMTFHEVERVLKPGGALLIGFIDRESVIGRRYSTSKNRSLFYRNATFYSPKEVSGLMKEAGFESISFVQTLFDDGKDVSGEWPVIPGFGRGSFVVARGIIYR